MFTKLTASQRIQVGLVLAIAFLMVLGSNRLDQQHFSTIQNTVNSVYKDRVVVQDFIYRLAQIVHEKEVRFIQNGQGTENAAQNQKIDQLLADFERTELTPEESKMLDRLTLQFTDLQALEGNIGNPATQQAENSGDYISNSKTAQAKNLRNKAQKMIGDITKNLDGLAQIQLSESSQLTQRSQKSLGMNILLSQLEVAFMIIIGVAMIALIFYPIETRKRVH